MHAIECVRVHMYAYAYVQNVIAGDVDAISHLAFITCHTLALTL